MVTPGFWQKLQNGQKSKDELLRTDTLNTDTEEGSVVIFKNDKNGNQLATYADKGTDTEKQYYVTDPHGNVVQLTGESGKVTKAYEYDSFGNEVKPDSKDDNPFRYCGEYYDQETEEIYLRARYYQTADICGFLMFL